MTWPAMSLAQANAALTAPGQTFEMEEILIDGAPRRAWKNGPKSLVDLWVATQAFGTADFLVEGDVRVSYDGFRRASFAFAQALRARGIGKGDRVAILMRNQVEWVVCFYGAALAGAIVTPLNAWWSADELLFGLKQSGARAAVCDDARYARIAERLAECSDVEVVFVADDGARPAGAEALSAAIGAPHDWPALPPAGDPPVAIAPDDPATIFYTSGTSGVPKGALADHRAVTTPIFASLFSKARAHLRRGEMPPAAAQTRRCSLLSIPLFHVTGCFVWLNISVALGGSLVLMRKWDAEEALRLIARERVDTVGGVPTIAWQLLEHPAREAFDLSSLETVAYGGAPAAPELVRRIRTLLPQAQPGSGWGMTETCATFTHHQAEDYAHRPDSCGPVTPVGEVRIVDAEGRTLPLGDVGELWVRGPHVVRAYWDNPAATAATFVDGWLRTGDLAKMDAEGFCTIVDRAKDVIIRGGENIYATEVEDVLYRHPAVMDAALVPIPHRTLGEEAAAFVTLKPETEASEEELKAFVGRHLAPFKIPAMVLARREPLPRNANGKIMKSDLRKALVETLKDRVA